MSSNKSLEHAFSLIATVLVAIAGAAAGGTLYISAAGATVGALVALAALAVVAIVFSALGLLGSTDDSEAVLPNQISATGGAPMAAMEPSRPSDVAPRIEATESEAQLLAAGKFAEYHLAKAKRLQVAGHLKEAAQQAAASLAHGHLADAVAIRQQSHRTTG